MPRASPSLPRFSAWVLGKLLPPRGAELLDEITDAFAVEARTPAGRRRARWKLRAEVVALLWMRLRGRLPADFSGRRAAARFSNPRPQVRKTSMDSLGQDIRFALRRLRARQGATLLIIALLALGIGVTATLYTVLDAVFGRPVPYPEADQLVAIGTTFGPDYRNLASMSWPNYADIASGTRSFAQIGAAWRLSLVVLDDDGARKVPAAAFSEEFLSLLGVSPALGRAPSAAEQRGEDAAVALLSYRAWQRLFGGESDLSTMEVRTRDRTYPVVGILPGDFVAPEAAGVGDAEIWLSAGHLLDRIDGRGARLLGVIARLADGADIEGAQAELDAVAKRLASLYPADNAPGDDPFGIGVRDLTRETAGAFGPAYGILAGAVVALMIIAAVNVAGLLLAQASLRRPEIALRTALGARRGHLVRQLLVESVVLSTLGGIAGTALAYAGVDAFVRAYPGALPRAAEIGLDARTVLFALALSLAIGVGCGLAPALRLACRPASAAGGRGATGPSSRRMLTSLVVVEIALAFVLFTAAALLVNSFVRLRTVAPGFDHRGLVVLRVDPGAAGEDVDAAREYLARALQAVRRVAGVESAATASNLPLESLNWRTGITFEDGRTSGTGVNARVVSAGYFATLGAGLVAGRDFGDGDARHAPPVAIVNQAFARRFLTGGPALERRLTFAKPFEGDQQTLTVVGVVADMKERVDAGPAPEVYVPMSQSGWPNAKIIYRPRGRLAGANVLEAVKRVDPDVPVDWQLPLDELIGAGIGQQQFLARMVSMLATLSVLLAGAGIYALVAHGVQVRRREIGVRMAIGADAREVATMVLRDALRWTLVGIVAGLAGAGAASRLLAGQLYEISAVDLPTYAGVTLVFTAIVVAAVLAPARRASSLDPVRCLRDG